MRKTISFTLLIAMIALLSVTFAGCGSKTEFEKMLESEYGFELAFEDDFDGDSVDYTKWRVGYTAGAGEDGALRRAGYYEDSADTIIVKDGTLTIRTLYKNGQYGEGWYTSWLETSVADSVKSEAPIKDRENYEGFEATYGYFEIRCIAPPCEGIWSAFWMMPDSPAMGAEEDEIPGGADGIEIDVMESPYYNQLLTRDTVLHVLHADGYVNTKTERSPSNYVRNMYSEFHTYGVLWTEDEYVFYIDGKETWRTSHVVNGEVLGVSEVPEYLLVTVEVGGYNENGIPVPGKNPDGSAFWCGDPNANDKTKSYDFVIDYVRAYTAV